MSRALSALSRALWAVSQRRVTARTGHVACRVSSARCPPCHDTKFVSRYKSPCRAHWAVSQPYCTVSWRAPALPLRPCLSRYKTLYLDLTPKWAVAHSNFISCTLFFFFFILFHLLEDHNKYIYIYIFPNLPVEQKKKFIVKLFFFSYFTLCKTSEKKNFLNIFFPMCYSSSIQAHNTYNKHHVIHPSTHKTQCMQCSNPVP